MKKILLLFVCAVSALVVSSSAGAAVKFGVTANAGDATYGGGFFPALTDLGFSENRVAILWDPAAPQVIPNQVNLDYWVPQASILGIKVIFAVYPMHATDLSASSSNQAQFAGFLQRLARTYPNVKDFIVGNEPNQPRFWQPQFDSKGAPLAAASYEKLLAQSYDALKAVDPTTHVIGLGLSPRGNDDPKAKDNVSSSPVHFLRDLGAAYRASGRTAPIMDELAFHPYPSKNNDAPGVGYSWPNAGLPNLDRVKQGIWDAFNGTAQPVFAERGKAASAKALKLDLDETGWQVTIPPTFQSLYFGKENVNTIDEQTQAQYYTDVVRLTNCDPNVRALSFFLLQDERDLDRWQSGLLRADGSKRPSYDAVRKVIAETKGECALRPVGWQHTSTLIGPLVSFGYLGTRRSWQKSWSFSLSAQEDANYRAGLFRVGGAKPSARARAAIASALAGTRVKPALSAQGAVKASHGRTVSFPARRVSPGWYVYAVRLTAAMNSKRANVFISRSFRVAGAAKKR